MQVERWEAIVGNIKDKFNIADEGKIHIDEEGGLDIHFIEFVGPLGLMRLEFVSKPLILDKKTTYSKRIGSETKIDYVYSENEKNHILMVYRWDDSVNDWQEVNDEKLFN